MKTSRKLLTFIAICSLLVVTLFALPNSAQALSEACANYASISTTVTTVGQLGGYDEPFEAGEVYVLTMTADVGSSITWRVVAQPSGTTTLGGPFTTTGTTTFTFTMPSSGQPVGIGFLIDAITGTGTLTASCGGVFAGRPIPADFVLRTITCSVAVFDAPGGTPVGANAIKGGQTWYVNPVSVKDASGKAWTEIYVSGSTNGYIPTSCVG